MTWGRPPPAVRLSEAQLLHSVEKGELVLACPDEGVRAYVIPPLPAI